MASNEVFEERKVLGWAVRMDTQDHLYDYLHSNPSVFISRISDQLRAQLVELATDRNISSRRRELMARVESGEDDPELSWVLMPSAVEGILDQIDGWRSQYERHELQFPLGAGPVEALWKQIDAGAIRVDQAEVIAGSGRAVRSMAPAYVYALSNYTVNLAHAGEYVKALTYHRVLLSSVDATVQLPEYAENMNVVGSDWVEIVFSFLAIIPDARLLRDAIDRGHRVVDRTRDSDPHLWHSLTLHRLGLLHLEPYIRGRSPERFPMQEKIWRSNFFVHNSLEAEVLSESVWQMPPIAEALAKAEFYLRDARARRSGQERALSTKALVDALYWKVRLGIAHDKAEIEVLSREALELGLQKYPEHVLHLTNILNTVTKNFRGSSPLTLRDVKDARGSLSKTRYCESLIVLGNIVQFSDELKDIEEYVGELTDSRQLFDDFARSAHKTARRKTLGRLVWRILAPSAPPHITDLETSRHHLALARPGRERAGNMLRLACHARTLEEQIAAHELMKPIAQEYPELVERYPDVLAQIKGDLSLNIGADFTNTRKFKQAAYAYAEALQNYLIVPDADLSREMLRRFVEVFRASKEDLIDVALMLLLGSGAKYELLCGGQAALELKKLADLCSARIYQIGGSSIEKLSTLIQLAKGRLFAGSCVGRPRVEVAAVPSLNELLKEIAWVDGELEKAKSVPIQAEEDELRGLQASEPPIEVDDDLYQLSCPVPQELATGDNLKVVRENLQYRFDAETRTLLWKCASRDLSPVMSISEISGSLDDETALLDIYLGADLDDHLAVYVFAYVRDGVAICRTVHTSYPSHFLFGARRGQRVLFSAMAGFVCNARRAILAEPGLGPVTPEAQSEFKRWVKGFFADSVLDLLSESGKSHLCFIPNGPLHFFPFHLLGPVEMPFGKKWNISYLPHMSLLNRTGSPRQSTRTMFAAGKSFVGPGRPGLQEMPDAVLEAAEIARIFGSRPVIEYSFTPSALLSALESSRYVHLSTHAEQNAVAPSFHRLFTSPGEDGSDVLNAYEIHNLDLSGIDLLTLSACETGLGRVDTGDNLGGLPASFIIAGARTVVATLWQVTPATSRAFFSRLYGELKEGKSKLKAFVIAQDATRQDFPAYRDWGAFYLLGDWN